MSLRSRGVKHGASLLSLLFHFLIFLLLSRAFEKILLYVNIMMKVATGIEIDNSHHWRTLWPKKCIASTIYWSTILRACSLLQISLIFDSFESNEYRIFSMVLLNNYEYEGSNALRELSRRSFRLPPVWPWTSPQNWMSFNTKLESSEYYEISGFAQLNKNSKFKHFFNVFGTENFVLWKRLSVIAFKYPRNRF